MNPILPDEYLLSLTTGEDILVSELDCERTPVLLNTDVLQAVRGLLEHCSFIPRSVVEEAKSGYDSNFKKFLRSGPKGSMMKSKSPACRLQDQCSMVNREICTLHNMSTTPIPICWEYDAGKVSDHVRILSIELGTVIGHAWRQDRFVILVGLEEVFLKLPKSLSKSQ